MLIASQNLIPMKKSKLLFSFPSVIVLLLLVTSCNSDLKMPGKWHDVSQRLYPGIEMWQLEKGEMLNTLDFYNRNNVISIQLDINKENIMQFSFISQGQPPRVLQATYQIESDKTVSVEFKDEQVEQSLITVGEMDFARFGKNEMTIITLKIMDDKTPYLLCFAKNGEIEYPASWLQIIVGILKGEY